MELRNPELLRSQCFAAGTWFANKKSAQTTVINPATEESIGTVPQVDSAETEAAIAAASAAWNSWKSMSAAKRSALLHEWQQLIRTHLDDLAVIMTSEQGKPLAESRGEIQHSANYIKWYAEEAKRLYGETIPSNQPNTRLIVLRQPVGVCAAITPWNFPMSTVARKIAPALAVGCTVVVKPAKQTPFSALALAFLAEKAGFPAGVINVVTGQSKEIGPMLATHPHIRSLSFTGSTEVGRLLMGLSATTAKKLSLELGGHAPFLVFDDADLDAAVQGVLASKFRNSGQTCVAANRMFVHKKVYAEFCQKLVSAVLQLRLGNGMLPGMDQGPLIDRCALLKVEEHIKDALQKGARLACGGDRRPGKGHFFHPTVLLNANEQMLIFQEETFGPVLPISLFEHEEKAIASANNTPYGLAAYLYSRNMGRIQRVAEALDCGMVGVNTGKMSSEAIPFGGVKASGFGREGARHGLDEFLETKYLCVNLGN